VPIQAPIVSQIDQPRVPSQFTRMVNHLGFCGLSTPMGMTEVGLPGGLQIIGRSNEETMTLRIGAAFANDFGDIGPPPDWD
jgi:aspartyl-tRNA(Asn)/glutamyl-tRNA(Gln) amidotransferase subunit A